MEVGDDGVVSLAGASLGTTTARVLRLDRGLSKQLSAWTPFGALHDTGKIVLDLAVASRSVVTVRLVPLGRHQQERWL